MSGISNYMSLHDIICHCMWCTQHAVAIEHHCDNDVVECRLVSRRSENGSRMRPATISFDRSASIMSGCLSVDARLRAVWGKRGPLYPVETPLSMPDSSHEIQALLG